MGLGLCPPPRGRERKGGVGARCLGLSSCRPQQGMGALLPCLPPAAQVGGQLVAPRGRGGCQSWGSWLEEGPLVGSREEGQLPALAPGSAGCRWAGMPGSACSSLPACPADGQGLQPVPAACPGRGVLGQAPPPWKEGCAGGLCLVPCVCLPSGCCRSCLHSLLLLLYPFYRIPCLVTPFPTPCTLCRSLSPPPSPPWPGGTIPPCFLQQQ